MKKSVKLNYIYNVSYQLLLIIIPIITTPYLARVLGPEGNGIYGYTYSIITYFTLLGTLGVSLYGQREVAYNQNNLLNRSKIFWEINLIRFITMGISIIVFFFMYCYEGVYSIYYRILIMEFISCMLTITWFFQGLEEFKIVVIRSMIIKFFSVILVFVLIKNQNDLWKYIAIVAGSSLLGSMSLWPMLKNRVKMVKFKDLNLKRHIKPILLLFIPQIALQIYTVLDKSMIGLLTNNMSEVAYYDQSQKIVKALLTVITSISTVMLPRIASCFAENNKKRIKEYMNNTFRFIFLFAFPLLFGIVAVANPFVPLFFGKGYEKIKIIMPLLSIIVIFISVSTIIGMQYLLSTKQQKKYTISIVVGAITNFILNLLLIGKFKSLGACVGTIVAEFVIMLLDLYFVRKDFDLIYIIKMGLKYLVLSLIMFIVIYPIQYLALSNFYILILQVFIGGLVYFILLLIVRDKFILEECNKFLEIINKKFKRV